MQSSNDARSHISARETPYALMTKFTESSVHGRLSDATSNNDVMQDG